MASQFSDRGVFAQDGPLLAYRRLIAATVLITFALIMLGAWVRLTDAGLGCPDWPGCYGKLTPKQASAEIADAVRAQGGDHGPVSMGKAWREMIHRYIASGLGLLILVIAATAWTLRARLRQSPILPTVLVGVVIFQGLLGMWTVTLLLKPAIVTLHLAGGMLTLALLVWLWQRQHRLHMPVDPEPLAALRGPALIGLVVLSLQILLGGWTSTNYAALACIDLPACNGRWWPDMNFADAFHVFRELGRTDDGEFLPVQALVAIHMMHRMGALVATAVLGWLAWRTLLTDGVRGLGYLLVLALALQVSLGLANIWLSLPLPVAVAHNGGAALLLCLLVVLNFRAVRARLSI